MAKKTKWRYSPEEWADLKAEIKPDFERAKRWGIKDLRYDQGRYWLEMVNCYLRDAGIPPQEYYCAGNNSFLPICEDDFYLLVDEIIEEIECQDQNGND